MPTEVFEFRASRLGSFLILIGSVVFAAAGLILWYQPDAPNDMRLWMGLFGIGAICVFFVVLYRLIVCPVMVRVSPEGLFIKNYDATIPWDALEKAKLIQTEQATELVEFVAKQPLHSSMTESKLNLGRFANNLVKLPDFVYSMAGIQGSNKDLLNAISFYLPVK